MKILSCTSKVLAKEQLTKDVVRLTLSVPDNFTFKAGQFVSIKCCGKDEEQRRSYSILSPSSQKGKIDLCIKLVDKGFASEIFSACKKGDCFDIKGPMGHFTFDEKDTHKDLWFLGAGTGVSPLHSMLFEYVPKMPDTKFTLLFGVRFKQNMFLHKEFEKLAKEYQNFTFVPVLSREKGWKGAKGHVQDNLPNDLKNKTFYICGLKELVLETKELLTSQGVDPKYLKTERYS